MYTSGSTGTPKGVVLPHEALVTTVKGFFFVVNPTRPGDIYLGYLPLAHILELLAEMTMLVQGIPVGYSSPNTMIDTSTKLKKGTKGDCTILRPTLMCAVPLVIDRIYKGKSERYRFTLTGYSLLKVIHSSNNYLSKNTKRNSLFFLLLPSFNFVVKKSAY